MPSFDDEQIQAMKDLRLAGFSKRGIAEAMDVSRNSVRKYEPEEAEGYDEDLEMNTENLVEALPPDINPANVLAEKYRPEGSVEGKDGSYTADPPSETPLRDEKEEELRVANDYERMTPGDFIETFFDEFEVGVKGKFVRMQKRRADRREEIPDEDKMLADIKDMSSGVANDTEARYISEEYWAEAQKYIGEADVNVFRRGDADDGSAQSQGGFVSPGGNQQGQGQWVQVPGQGMMYGQFVEGPNGQQVFQAMQPPNQQGQMAPQQMGGFQGQQQGQNAEVQAIKDEMRELRRDLNSDDSGGLESELQRFQTIKTMMDELADNGGESENREGIRVLQQELQRLRQEMSDNAQDVQTNDPQEAMFKRLMADDTVSTDKVLEYAEKLEGSVDPEVRKKEIERDVEMQKLEQKRQQTEALVDKLSGLASAVGEGFGKALSASPANQNNQQQAQQQPPQQESQQTQERPPQQEPQQQQVTQADAGVPDGGDGLYDMSELNGEPWDCPECGETSMVDPTQPGVECRHCDYSKMPCPDCRKPVEIPPADEHPRSHCPECEEPLMLPDDMDETVACLGCEWTGPAREAAGEPIECENCGSEHYPQPAPSEAM